MRGGHDGQTELVRRSHWNYEPEVRVIETEKRGRNVRHVHLFRWCGFPAAVGVGIGKCWPGKAVAGQTGVTKTTQLGEDWWRPLSSAFPWWLILSVSSRKGNEVLVMGCYGNRAWRRTTWRAVGRENRFQPDRYFQKGFQ